MGPDTPDEELMRAFQRGDARAFEQLVARHRAPVFNFVLRYTGQRARAEDLLQETWLKVVRSARDYEPKARFTTWLYTIARNLCVDSARKETHRKTESLEASGPDSRGLSDVLPTDAAGPDRAAYNLGLRPLLQKALDTLPPEQREVFLLREYQGIAFKEIAGITGVPEPTVKSRMRYALEGLRRALDELGVEGEWLAPERTVVG